MSRLNAKHTLFGIAGVLLGAGLVGSTQLGPLDPPSGQVKETKPSLEDLEDQLGLVRGLLQTSDPTPEPRFMAAFNIGTGATAEPLLFRTTTDQIRLHSIVLARGFAELRDDQGSLMGYVAAAAPSAPSEPTEGGFQAHFDAVVPAGFQIRNFGSIRVTGTIVYSNIP